jgi:hypothetical protein
MDVPWKAWNVYRKTTPPTEVPFSLQLQIICNSMPIRCSLKELEWRMSDASTSRDEDADDGQTKILERFFLGTPSSSHYFPS